MNYVIHSMGMPFNGSTIKTQSLGGSETAAYYLGKELAARGHRVIMFTNSQEGGEFDGVMYEWCGNVTQQNPLGERFAHFACNTPHDVLVIQRHPLAFHKDYASKINVHQMHDLALRRTAGAINAGAARVDLVTGVSDFHIKQIKDVYNLPDRTLRAVPNGVDASLYGHLNGALPAFHAVGDAKDNGSFPLLYQSRPERGLIHLLAEGGIMAKLAAAGSKAHLFYCAYQNTVAEMQPLYQHLDALASKLPNVTNLGALTKAELAAVQVSCSLLVYPTEFEEVSCITAMEAMHAGLPLVTSAHAALPETCKDSGSILLPLKDKQADEGAFVTRILALELDEKYREELRAKQLEAAQLRTWEHAVDIFEDAVAEAFARRAASPARMARHLIEHSDISALKATGSIGGGGVFGDSPDAIIHKAAQETEEMYSFTQSPEATAKHYEKWEGLNCDHMEATGLNSDVEQAQLVTTSRFRGIQHLLAQSVAEKLNEGKKLRVLEFGCAHGHITCALAQAFPQIEFTGMDFMARSVQMGNDTAARRGLKNVTFGQGSLEDLVKFEKFDAVIAPEVVEHIWDYRGALNALVNAVKPGGELIITTPTGRWEWTGRHWWHKGREHLHHFERADIAELFAEFSPTILHAPGGHDVGGEALGSWCYSAHVTVGAKIGDIDYARKLKEQAPRDTVSLCMIVKDAQETVANAIRSVADVVDEVVIAIDNATTDRTESRIDEVKADFPHVAFTVFRAESPLKIGFDEARNATVERSCGDWILWLDADEEVAGSNNILRLLRPGAFDGYAIAQHHMSQDPPECISTDYPTRLFRRDSGAKFFGVVHEHPEVEIGKAIPHTQQIGDVKIIHYGYTDETTRRGRFVRNFPLLLKDLEKHPNRTLNKFLHLRDLAQSIAFEGGASGNVTPEMVGKAEKIIALFRELIDVNPMMRMTLDAIPYYSTAVAVLGGGFKAKISIRTSKEEFPGIAAQADTEGLFDSVDTYTRLMARIAKETTTNYEATYL